MDIATFGAGCFWHVELAFSRLNGVIATAVGYAGGTTDNPTYHDVCSKTTGHAEAVQISFDPVRVSYEKLLELFWNIHDPTQLNRQGVDVGVQYRSVIFYHSPDQKSVAEQSKQVLQESPMYLGRVIVTQISPAPHFWKAEEYHQQYLIKHGKTYC
ncbi:peptide-methionine (S)-S-oxide reductase MsrA [bacterium]|nr:peptide-methionine (S)-S-oxide reductase MsrA [bacterium]MCP5462819.1 peptide-methionine (S)-S-oxide reductase MsrA [bacterium]MCP5463294.1 peptide-methionine (S)-S-oxide reductase MsrA [bacterium]